MASYERPVEPPDRDASWRAQVRDRLRSLTRALAVVAVLTVAALGIALWALIADEDDDGRGRAGAIRALEDRVDELEAEVERAPSRVEVSIRDEQRSLDERFDELEENTSDALEDVRQDLEQLQQRVDELEQRQQRPTTPEP
jgi:DNA repair exonuclease SbcCD ATPase subunit